MIIKEDLQVHESLNPIFWDGMALKNEIKDKIVEIVADFEEYIAVPIDIIDIQLVGSNASYNYTEHSDLDVHIIANFENVTSDVEILQALYDTKKTNYNRTYDIKLKGIDIELYVQDVRSSTVSNGIYSVCEDRWVKEPKPITSIKHYDLTEEMGRWKVKISEILQQNNRDEIATTLNILYLIRHNSISADGEYGKGNQLFKEIRNEGLLDQLKDALAEATSRELSLEGFSRGQLVNRFD